MSNEYDNDQDQVPEEDLLEEMEAFEDMATHFGQTFDPE